MSKCVAELENNTAKKRQMAMMFVTVSRIHASNNTTGLETQDLLFW